MGSKTTVMHSPTREEEGGRRGRARASPRREEEGGGRGRARASPRREEEGGGRKEGEGTRIPQVALHAHVCLVVVDLDAQAKVGDLGRHASLVAGVTPEKDVLGLWDEGREEGLKERDDGDDRRSTSWGEGRGGREEGPFVRTVRGLLGQGESRKGGWTGLTARRRV